MRQTLFAGWTAFVYLLVGVSGSHFWLDSGELAAAGHELGVSHPPGTPGFVLLLRLATLVGVGSLGFRMALLSALLGALAVAGVVAISRERGASPWVSLGIAAWLLAGWTFVRESRVVEIYALEAALLVAVAWGFDPEVPDAQRTRRRLLGTMAAVWAAWCFGDLRLALVVPVIVGWGVALRRGRAWARWAPLAVVVASSVVLSVILASARHPIADWGQPSTLANWWDHTTALSIRRAFAEEILPSAPAMWGHNAMAMLRGLAEDLGPLGLPLFGIALLSLWLRDAQGQRRIAVALGLTYLALVLVVYAVGINPMGIADRQTGMGLAVVAALVVGEAVRRWELRLGRAAWAVLPLLGTTLIVPAALRSVPDLSSTRSHMPHRWTAAALGQLPPGSLLLTQSDDLAAGVAAAKQLEGARPDVAAIPSQHLYKAAPAGLRPGHPVLEAFAASSSGPDEATRIEQALAGHRGPVALESPAAGLHIGVRFWSDRGNVPLRVGKLTDPMRAQLPVAERPDEALARWIPEIHSESDRTKLATALSNDARGVLRVERNMKRSIATLVTVVDHLAPRHPSALVALGALRDRLGDHASAIELTRRALRAEPDRDAALTNLSLYLSRDTATLDEAGRLAQRAVALRPSKPTGWVRLAAVRELQGDPEGAAAARAQLQSLAP